MVLVLSRTIPDGDRDVDGANPRVGFLIGACVAGHGHRKVRSRAEYAPSAIALTTGSVTAPPEERRSGATPNSCTFARFE